MKVMFKGVKDAIECTEPVEQKLFQSGVPVGWAVMFHLHGALSSSEVDSVVTPETISELVFTGVSGETPTSITLKGYSAIRACTIRHRAGKTVTELQFTKENSVIADEGATVNE